MGAHRWVLGPIITLILAVAVARPPQCEEAPLWSIEGRQPLLEFKGNVTVLALLQASWQFCLLQAENLELLRQHFSYLGMKDIEFIIVNSKLSHARLLRKKLENLVSFEVFQDSEEQDVWNSMEGGKDDIYVYDKCGRLAYYIPYPISIINANGVVPKAIIATYFNSPCGNDTLCTNLTSSTSDYTEEVEISTQTHEVMSHTVTNDEDYFSSNVTQVDSTRSNKTQLVSVNNTVNETNNFEAEEDYDYFSENQNTSKPLNPTNSISNLFFNLTGGNSSTEHNTTTHSNTSDASELTNTVSVLNDTDSHGHHTDHMTNRVPPITSKKQSAKSRRKSDRCRDADIEVCKDFTKKRLLRIQACCLPGSNGDKPACRSFTQKRCKKMRTVIKCCIKTSIADETTVASTTVTELATVSDLVCCKDTPEGKFCRVSQTGICDEDGEYEEVVTSTEETPTQASMWQNVPWRQESEPSQGSDSPTNVLQMVWWR